MNSLQSFTDLLDMEERFSYQSEICNFVNSSINILFWNILFWNSEWLNIDYRIADNWHIDNSLKENLDFIRSKDEIDAFSEIEYDNDTKYWLYMEKKMSKKDDVSNLYNIVNLCKTIINCTFCLNIILSLVSIYLNWY